MNPPTQTALTPLERELLGYLEKLSKQFDALQKQSNMLGSDVLADIEMRLDYLELSQQRLSETQSELVEAWKKFAPRS